jgi:monooxygenase
VTDELQTFTEHGIKLRSGEEPAADIVVTATGRNVVVLGDIQISVYGRTVDISKTMNYIGTMYNGVPNFASVSGYTNASWTLKCQLTCRLVCRLLNCMDKKGYRACMLQNNDSSVKEDGTKKPWKLYNNYLLDMISLGIGSLNDGVLKFAR